MDDLERYQVIFDLKPGASKEDIKQAYRDLVKVWHPDRFRHDPRLQEKAQEKLKEINEAYEKLCFCQGIDFTEQTKRSEKASYGNPASANSRPTKHKTAPPSNVTYIRTRRLIKFEDVLKAAVILYVAWLFISSAFGAQ